MKLFNIILSGLLVLGLATSCGSKGNAKKSASSDEGFVSIFDGKTTTGWRGYDKPAFPDSGWVVQDGTLHCIGSGNGEAGSGGDIIYDKKLSNFELQLDWKIAAGGNSGVFILAQEIPNEPIWKSGLEMQILDNEKHPDAKLGVNGDRMAGSLYDLIPANPQNTKPAGEWNHIDILVYQGTVVFSQNGAHVVEFHLWTEDWKKMIANSKFKDYEWVVNPAKEGYIGLQDHGDDVWFKNIKLKML
jgi:alpha-3'-ketoglucosidase